MGAPHELVLVDEALGAGLREAMGEDHDRAGQQVCAPTDTGRGVLGPDGEDEQVDRAGDRRDLRPRPGGCRHVVEAHDVHDGPLVVRSPAVQEKPDDGDCAEQSGSTGFSVTVTRIFRDLQSGAEIKREQFNTRYAAEPVIRCVPPDDDDAEPTGAPASDD